MIILTQITGALALLSVIAYPIIKFILKGAVDWCFINGLVLGLNSGSQHFKTKMDGVERIFEMYTIQFHLLFITISMAFSVERPDAIEKEQ
jgi:hypothetical protein